MKLSPLALPLMVLSVAAAAHVQSFGYQAGASSYEFVQNSTASMAGMGSEETKIFARFGVNIAAGKADTLQVTVDLDSATSSESGSMKSLLPRGARTVMHTTRGGRLAVEPTESDILASMARELFIHLPANAGVGASVTDTTNESIEEAVEMGIPTITTITTARITGDTTINGEQAWKIDLKGAMTPVTKDTTMQGGALSMKISVRGDVSGTAYFAKNGAMLSLNKNESTKMQMDMSIMGNAQSISIEESHVTDIRKVK